MYLCPECGKELVIFIIISVYIISAIIICDKLLNRKK